MEAVKNTVNSVIPVDVQIPIDYGTSETAATAVELRKKIHCDVYKSLNYNEKVYSFIIQSMNTHKPDTTNSRYLKCFIAAKIQ